MLGNSAPISPASNKLSIKEIYQQPLNYLKKNQNKKIADAKNKFVKKYANRKKVYVIEDSPLLQSHQLRKPFVQMTFEDHYFSILKNYYLQLK
jgi:hypothetical protein